MTTSAPTVIVKICTPSRGKPPIWGWLPKARAKKGFRAPGRNRYGSVTFRMSTSSKNSGATRLNSASASAQGRFSDAGPGPRRRIFSALHNTSADSASRGRFRPGAALAISTARTSSACSRRKARG